MTMRMESLKEKKKKKKKGRVQVKERGQINNLTLIIG